MKWAVVFALVVGLSRSSPAAADRLTVVEVIGATSDVHDAIAIEHGLLLATSGGLVAVRDGVVDRTLTSRDGLPGSRLRSLSRVDAGVWVGGVDGAALIDPVTFAVVRTIALRRVTRAVHWQGQTWFATHGDGLHRLDDTAGARVRAVPIGRQRTRLTDLAVVGDQLWVASAGGGIARVDASGALAGTIGRRHGLPSNLVWQLVPDRDRLLVATAGGIAAISGGQVARRAQITARSAELAVRDVRSIAVGAAGELHAATFGGGLWRFDSDTSSPRRVGTGARRGRIVVASPAGLWVGHDRGLDRVDADQLTAVVAGGLPSPDITCLAHAFGALWIGTFSDGLARRDPGGTIVAVTGELDARINDLAVTRDHAGGERLWIATDRGLWSFDGARFERASGPAAPADVHVTALHVDVRGALWAASNRTLSRLERGSWRAWTGDRETPVLGLHAITTDGDGTVWAGSLYGLLELSPADGVIRHHTVASGEFAVDWVTSVAVIDGGIVAGTYHGGLSWFRGGKVRLERERRGGLPAGWINPHAIRVDRDRLWIGTLDRGLVVGKTGNWSRLTIGGGLPGNDVTAIADAGGDAMWVATRAGLARVATAQRKR